MCAYWGYFDFEYVCVWSLKAVVYVTGGVMWEGDAYVEIRVFVPHVFSLVGWRGYRAAVGNVLLIGVTRSLKIHRKRFAMLTSQQNVPRVILCKLYYNTTIIENESVLLYRSQHCR